MEKVGNFLLTKVWKPCQYFLCQSKQPMVLKAIHFLLCSLIANMVTVLIHFQQKFALGRSFQHFVLNFGTEKDFLLA